MRLWRQVCLWHETFNFVIDLLSELKKIVKGEALTSKETLEKYSRDASIFQVMPSCVVFPKDSEDIKNLVKFVSEHKEINPELSLTARAAGSDMSGGPLNESIVLDFLKYFKKIDFEEGTATVQPGVFYRDFEVQSLNRGLLLPSFPASKSLAALGGMIANNAAGEKTLKYGQTRNFVKELRVVLQDGNEYTFKKIDKDGLEAKKVQNDFEGEIYHKLYNLLEDNYDLVQNARPKVSKNSAGYALWDVWDRKSFDMTQLFVGSQGTLGIITEARLNLVKIPSFKRLAVLFLKDIKELPEIVNAILPLKPESLEVFDDKTLKLAIRFFPSIAKKIKGENLFSLLLKFIPEFLISVRMLGLPSLTILVEFAENEEEIANKKIELLKAELKNFNLIYRIVHTEKEAEKYWTIRRESFSLLRQHVKGKRTAPFIDDLIVKPEKLPEILPKIHKILKECGIEETIAGHAGSGNIHIIPLMNLKDKKEREKILEVSDKIYDLVIQYEGSITGEHNDGLIRSPYLEKMYGREVTKLFEGVKNIFDPKNIFNPGKKVYSSLDYSMEHIDTTT